MLLTRENIFTPPVSFVTG